MSRLRPSRVGAVRVDPPADTARLCAALLAGSPRVVAVGADLARVDARGWDRRGGEPALARVLARAAEAAGFTGVGVGLADVPVAADAAARLAAAEGSGARFVPPGESASFLAPLPLAVLPLPDELAETFRALGLRRVGELAGRPAAELEARFGPEGVRAHRFARGEDDRPFRTVELPELPEASLELDAPADTLEPLLFVLRHLLARICVDLIEDGRCAARLDLELRTGRGSRTATAVPARPTRHEHLLYDLCRSALERASGAPDRLEEPVSEIVLRVAELAPPDARQEDLFTRRWRDPLAAASALSRLRVRLGEDAIVHPVARAEHRPESRSAWMPVEIGTGGGATDGGPTNGNASDGEGVPGVLHLLPEPRGLRVRPEEGPPAELWGEAGHHEVVAAEGPERLSGDWWTDPYHREYFRVCTEDGGLLWLFREYRPSGELRWWLHGWWD